MNYNVLNLSEDVINRFWSKVNVKHLDDGTPDFNACMEWTTGCFSDGYGAFSLYRKTYRAHRFSYMCFNGSISSNQFVCHNCDNPLCVNPNHLWLGTVQDNSTDMVQKDRAAKGSNNGFSKLNESQVLQIKFELSRGIPATHIGKKFGVNRSAISRIKSGETWSHIQFNIDISKIQFDKSISNYSKGSKVGTSKLIETDIPIIRNRIKSNGTCRIIAIDYAVSESTINNIKNNKTWNHVI